MPSFTNASLQEGTYFQNRLIMNMNGRRIRAEYFERHPPVQDVWFKKLSLLTKIGALYYPLENTAFLPLSIVRPPFFHANYPSYISYGALGHAIGHEITHGFDNTGRKFDSTGKIFLATLCISYP